MTDIAHLTYDIDSSPATQAANDLDRMSAAGKRAEQTAAGVSGGAKRMSSAMLDMLGSIDKSTRELVELTRQQRLVAQATDAVAASETRAAATARAATSANVAYSHSFTQVVSDAARAAAAIDKTGAAATKAAGQARAAANHFDTLFDATSRNFATQYNAQMGVVTHANDRVAKSNKHLTMAGLDLSRQFADIGVSAASNIPIWMVIIQQGPQIADRLALMKMEGIGLTAVLRGMAAAAVPAMVALAPLIAVAGAAAAGFALMHRELSKGYPDDVTDGLHLTEEQLERVTHKTVTMGDTFGATMEVAAKYLTMGPLGAALDWLAQTTTTVLDGIAVAAFESTAVVVGSFLGAYRTIIDNWKNFPAVLGDLFVMATNAALSAVEKLINGATSGLNKIFDVMRLAPQWSWLPTIPEADLSKFQGQVKGAAEFTGRALLANVGQAIDDVRGGMRQIGKEIGVGAEKRATDQALKQAGKANKGPASRTGSSPRDTTDERSAQIDALLAQAKAEELRAQLDLTEDLRKRADIEKEIAGAQLASKQAGLNRQIADIAYDVERKRLTEAAGGELTAQLNLVKATNQRVADLQAQKTDRDLQRSLIKQATDIEAASLEGQIDLLSGQGDTARFASERSAIDQQILAIQQRLVRLKLREVIDTTAAGTEAHRIAVAQMAIRDEVEQYAREGLRLRTLESATREAAGAIADIGHAVRDHDWGRLFTSLVNVVDQAIVAFANAKTSAERMSATGSLFSAAGGAVGGKAGSVLGSVGAGFSAAGSAAGMAGSFGAIGGAIAGLAGPIGIAVAGFSLLSSVLGKNKAKERAKNEEAQRRAQDELNRVVEIANQKRDLEIDLLEAQGNAVGALAARRKIELAALDASNRALQEAVWVEKDLAEARQKTVDVAQTAVDDARSRLTEAYDAEAGALQATIDKFAAFSDSLKKFRASLYSGPAAMLSPEEQYRAARSEFDDTSARAASGDEGAIRDLQSVSEAYLEASKSYFASSKPYFEDLERVRAAVTATQSYAASQVDVGQAQLTALNASVSGILTVNNSVLSVRDALAGYQSAIQALAAAQAAQQAANDNGAGGSGAKAADWSSYIATNGDVAAEYMRNQGSAKGREYLAQIGATSAAAFGQWHYNQYGKAEGRTPFATGGSFTVGGSGGTDSQDFGPIALSPGEIVNVRRPGDQTSDLAPVVAKLEQIVDELKADKLQRAAVDEAQKKRSDQLENEIARLSRSKVAA